MTEAMLVGSQGSRDHCPVQSHLILKLGIWNEVSNYHSTKQGTPHKRIKSLVSHWFLTHAKTLILRFKQVASIVAPPGVKWTNHIH